MTLEVGDIVQEKYRIVRLIGEGGMGAVYEGENVLIARRVAIKVLHNSAAVNPDIVQRFQREAQAAGRIGNDHILDVLDLGTLPERDLFMVMEYLDGENFADRIDRLGRLAPQQVYPLARQILEGLGAAHGAGIIHRDLKPENIFILNEKAGYRDFVKIIDFGISKFNVMDGNMQMTATGAVMGTPYYMAPEQAKGVKGADPRSDIYAVGVLLYKAVTGDEPFSAETFNELLFKIVLSDLVPAKQLVPDLDPAFDSIISKAMAKDPSFRFASCEDMTRALDAWAQTGAPVTVPPPPETNDPRVLAGVAPAPQAAPQAQQLDPSQSGSQVAAAAPDWRQSDAGVGTAQAFGQQAPAAQTPGSWANPSAIAVPRKSHAGLAIGVAGIALLLLVVGAVGAYKLVSSSSSSEGESEAATASEGNEEQKQESSAAKDAKEDQVEVKPVEATTETKADDEAQDKADAGADEPEKKQAAAPSRPAPAPRPRPAPPAPVHRPKPKSGAMPDFGY